jgi:hypothetical protein
LAAYVARYELAVEGPLREDHLTGPFEVRRDPVRKHTEALNWRIEPIHPYRRITKTFCAGGIPSAESDEGDLLAMQPDASSPIW